MGASPIIRLATARDVAGIARVHVASWRVAYDGILPPEHIASRTFERRRAMWTKWIGEQEERRNFLLVAVAPNREIVGFASAGPEREKDPDFAGEVQALYLHPAWFRHGIGRRLMNEAAWILQRRGMNSMLVWTFELNPARHFYERLGGTRARHKTVEFGGKPMAEIGFGWRDLAATFGAPPKSQKV